MWAWGRTNRNSMEITDVRLPYLVQSGRGNLFVEFRARNPKTGMLKRYRISKGLTGLSGSQLDERVQQIIAQYAKLLREGWRPWQDGKVIVDDETKYFHPGEGIDVSRKSSQIRVAFNNFLVSKKAEVKPKSFATYQSKIRIFLDWFEATQPTVKTTAKIDADMVRQFFQFLITKKRLDKRTVAKYRQILYTAFEHMKEARLLRENPVKHTPKGIKLVDRAARPITDEHMKLLLKHFYMEDQQMFLATNFNMLTLLRPNAEMRLLRLYDVDVAKRSIYLSEPNAKTKGRVIVMPDILAEIWLMYQYERYPADYFIFGQRGNPGPVPVGVNYFNRKFTAARDALKLPQNYTFYSMKHTGAGKLLESGATLAELMSHLGHKRFESTIAYVRRHFGERSEKIVNFKPDFLNGLVLKDRF